MFRPNKFMLFPLCILTTKQTFVPTAGLYKEISTRNKDMKIRHVETENVAPRTNNASAMEVDLEEALDIAGAGKYQLFHCTLMLTTMLAAILEMIGIAFILPAAACDLDVPDHVKGIIASIPNIGIIVTAPFWGRAADSWGRKPVLLGSLAAAGVMSFVAAFMPTLLSFAMCKFAGSLFLSVPSSLGYAYACEMLPRKRRDGAVLISSSIVNLLTVLSPGLAWAILSSDWRYQFGMILLRPWRLLTAVYATPLLLTAAWMTTAKESPKFLLTKGKDREALDVLKYVYSRNMNCSEDSFSVKSLKSVSDQESNLEQSDSGVALEPRGRRESPWGLLRPPHLKWFALTAFLMFGLFTFLNGLFLLAPDTLNKVMSESEGPGTVCELTNQSNNANSTSDCVDSISHNTFLIMVVTTFIYGVLVIGASISPLSKKTLLSGMFVTVGVGCLIAGLTNNRVVAGIALSSLQITALGVGPLTAYVVHLFPTSLRGTAVGAVMMFGRLGSVSGANAAGFFLNVACAATFYGFSLLVFLCAALSFLLPADHVASVSTENLNRRS